MSLIKAVKVTYEDGLDFDSQFTKLGLHVMLHMRLLDTNDKRRELGNMLDKAVSVAIAEFELGATNG